jgi:hypothetical protein
MLAGTFGSSCLRATYQLEKSAEPRNCSQSCLTIFCTHTRGIVGKLSTNFRVATGAQAVIWHVAFWQERSPQIARCVCGFRGDDDRDNVEHKPPTPVATKSVHLPPRTMMSSLPTRAFGNATLEMGCDFLRQLLFHLKPNVTLQEDYARVQIDETAL